MDILDIAKMECELHDIAFSKEAIAKLKEVNRKINASCELKEIFEAYYREEIETGKWIELWDMENPDSRVEAAFGREFTLFYLLCYLQKIFFAKQQYEKLGISREIYVKTLSDIGVWLENWKKTYGFYCFRNLGWIWRHLEVKLFRIDRLQYQLNQYGGPAIVFKNKASGKKIAFSSDSMEINEHGDVCGSGEAESDTPLFISAPCEITQDKIKGNPITPYGKVLREKIVLQRDEWECVLRKKDTVLELHIPRDGSFTPAACRESYKKAVQFYEDIYGVKKISGLTCHSWLFTPQLQEILEETSNIVKFQREFYLLPNKGSYHFAWNFVFNETTTIENAPQDTYLRRALVDYVKNKRPLFDLCGVCLNPWQIWGDQKDMKDFDQGEWDLK